MTKTPGATSSRNGAGGRVPLLLISMGLACERGTPAADQSEAAAPEAPAAALALRTPSGAEVWFGDAREGRDSTGATCVERTLEIRGPTGRRIVPLLYTLDTPTVLDDSTIRAHLFTDCRPGPAYRVDLRTGLPVRTDP
jgi:hypothetical protein